MAVSCEMSRLETAPDSRASNRDLAARREPEPQFGSTIRRPLTRRRARLSAPAIGASYAARPEAPFAIIGTSCSAAGVELPGMPGAPRRTGRAAGRPTIAACHAGVEAGCSVFAGKTGNASPTPTPTLTLTLTPTRRPCPLAHAYARDRARTGAPRCLRNPTWRRATPPANAR